MTTEPKLEQYLSRLDKALEKISVSDRADIITEIKSHVLEAQERDPNQGIGQLLAAMGEPESVASRYLMERGLKPAKPTKAPIVKWLTIGFLGTLGILVLSVLLIIWKFTPLIQIDKNGVTLGGGLIVLEGESSNRFSNKSGKRVTGSALIEKSKVDNVQILFVNGDFKIEPSPVPHQLSWDCVVAPFHDAENAGTVLKSESAKTLTLDFKQRSVDCKIALPVEVTTKLVGDNGDIDVIQPQSPLDIVLVNGDVSITPQLGKHYRYDVHVVNGDVGGLDSDPSADAIPIKISVVNGDVQLK